jgi:phage gpG-like protein
MTPKQFEQEIKNFAKQSREFTDKIAPKIAGNIAVSKFKQNFQDGGFFGKKWKEVKRRTMPVKTVTRGKRIGKKYQYPSPAQQKRKILTGDTGDLGRSIELKQAANGKAVIHTSLTAFSSKEPYGSVHNEGLRSGRAKGFKMPKRQFIGEHPKLNKAIIDKLKEYLNKIFKK